MRDLLGVTTLSDGKAPSTGLYDDFDGPMNASAWRLFQEVGAAELDRFFEEVVFSKGSFADLFLSNVGFVNKVSCSTTAPPSGSRKCRTATPTT